MGTVKGKGGLWGTVISPGWSRPKAVKPGAPGLWGVRQVGQPWLPGPLASFPVCYLSLLLAEVSGKDRRMRVSGVAFFGYWPPSGVSRYADAHG